MGLDDIVFDICWDIVEGKGDINEQKELLVNETMYYAVKYLFDEKEGKKDYEFAKSIEKKHPNKNFWELEEYKQHVNDQQKRIQKIIDNDLKDMKGVYYDKLWYGILPIKDSEKLIKIMNKRVNIVVDEIQHFLKVSRPTPPPVIIKRLKKENEKLKKEIKHKDKCFHSALKRIQELTEKEDEIQINILALI